jgi:hypothetical protein
MGVTVAEKTERSNCRFQVEKTPDGKSILVVHLYHQTIPGLKDAKLGFGLLGGLPPESVKRLAETLNEQVLDLFVTTKQPG